MNRCIIKFFVGKNLGYGFAPATEFYVYRDGDKKAADDCLEKMAAFRQKWTDISPDSELEEIKLEFSSSIRITDGFWTKPRVLPSPPPFHIPQEIKEAQEKIKEFEKLLVDEWVDISRLDYTHTDDVWFNNEVFEVGEHETWRGNPLIDLIDKGKHLPLKVKWTVERGYSLFTSGRIEAGTLLFQYAGEILYNDDAYQRNMDYQFWAGTDFHIDAQFKGNLSRFINHICDGRHADCNVAVDLIEDTDTGMDGFFRILLYTKKNIEPDQELLFNYRSGARKKLTLKELEDYKEQDKHKKIMCKCPCDAIHKDYPFVF